MHVAFTCQILRTQRFRTRGMYDVQKYVFRSLDVLGLMVWHSVSTRTRTFFTQRGCRSVASVLLQTGRTKSQISQDEILVPAAEVSIATREILTSGVVIQTTSYA